MSPGSVRAGSMSPEYPPAGSMSPELVYAPARAGSMSPDSAQQQGRGHTPMTEDELVCTPAPAPSTAAHSEPRTYHCERVRKMPLSGLDPSLLLGFVCRDESEWVDLRRRIGEERWLLLRHLSSSYRPIFPSPRSLLTCTAAIFALQGELSTWPGADDDALRLKSLSDPEEEAAFDDADMSSASHAPSSNSSHAAASTFSHTHQYSNSNTTASSGVDTEDDPVALITPLPGARFEISPALTYTDLKSMSAFWEHTPRGAAVYPAKAASSTQVGTWRSRTIGSTPSRRRQRPCPRQSKRRARGRARRCPC
ncbi:hypothetical protein DFH09DRAFT_340227 [Mycena vulgaris]|nr:hypothetical protein DFH09DRAFT_340227 [Mycena vulgaris]